LDEIWEAMGEAPGQRRIGPKGLTQRIKDMGEELRALRQEKTEWARQAQMMAMQMANGLPPRGHAVPTQPRRHGRQAPFVPPGPMPFVDPTRMAAQPTPHPGMAAPAGQQQPFCYYMHYVPAPASSPAGAASASTAHVPPTSPTRPAKRATAATAAPATAEPAPTPLWWAMSPKGAEAAPSRRKGVAVVNRRMEQPQKGKSKGNQERETAPAAANDDAVAATEGEDDAAMLSPKRSGPRVRGSDDDDMIF